MNKILRKKLPHIFAAALAIGFIFPLALTSCGGASEAEEDKYNTNDGADLEDSEYCKNLGNRTSITLTGVYGKKLLYANYNNAHPYNGSPIHYNSTRFITSTSGIGEEVPILTFAGQSSGRSALPSAQAMQAASRQRQKQTQNPAIHTKAFKEPQSLRKTVLAGFSRRGRSAARSAAYNHDCNTIYDNNSVLEGYTPGSTTRRIYVDVSNDMNSYAAKDATLCAVGYYNQQIPVVLVWVVNESLGNECKGTTVNQDLAQDVADKFAAHYYYEREIFGEEYDFLFDASCHSSPTEAYKIEDTGSLVNIVIYDIANDHGQQENESGVAGYFFGAKDYFKQGNYRDARRYSNKGKYFYLDAAFCNNGNGYANPSSTVSNLAITTLFHEFQHMIHFGQKTIYGIESDTWYNEMLSMLCEDLMAEQLGTGNSAPQTLRISDFKNKYYLSGIDEFRDDDEDTNLSSYANSYTFGAWLAREFGGPQFVSTMSKDHSRANMESVLYSIYANTGRKYSRRQVYKLFIQACIFRSPFAEENSLPTLNKDAEGSMTAIDLFRNDDGPEIVANGYSPDIRPHGFVIHSIGTATSDTVTLNFSPRIDAREDVMIYIQDDF